MSDYRLQFAARNEGLRYEDHPGVYRFDLGRRGDTWIVTIPPSKEPGLLPAEMPAVSEAIVRSRIAEFLSRVLWLGVWPRDYKVQFVFRQDA